MYASGPSWSLIISLMTPINNDAAPSEWTQLPADCSSTTIILGSGSLVLRAIEFTSDSSTVPVTVFSEYLIP